MSRTHGEPLARRSDPDVSDHDVVGVQPPMAEHEHFARGVRRESRHKRHPTCIGMNVPQRGPTVDDVVGVDPELVGATALHEEHESVLRSARESGHVERLALGLIRVHRRPREHDRRVAPRDVGAAPRIHNDREIRERVMLVDRGVDVPRRGRAAPAFEVRVRGSHEVRACERDARTTHGRGVDGSVVVGVTVAVIVPDRPHVFGDGRVDVLIGVVAVGIVVDVAGRLEASERR